MLANRMGAWSDVAFSRYFARNTSVQKLQLSDKTINFQTVLWPYHRYPEAEPDIESGLQGCLFVPLTRLQTVTANDLVCAQQRCLY
jgi:hypothetical protein